MKVLINTQRADLHSSSLVLPIKRHFGRLNLNQVGLVHTDVHVHKLVLVLKILLQPDRVKVCQGSADKHRVLLAEVDRTLVKVFNLDLLPICVKSR